MTYILQLKMISMFMLKLCFQDTNKQVKDTDFPSVTICTEGINMDAVLEAVSQDFNAWVKETKKIDPSSFNYTSAMKKADIKVYLHNNFGIDPKYNISIDDIALAYSSPEPEK